MYLIKTYMVTKNITLASGVYIDYRYGTYFMHTKYRVSLMQTLGYSTSMAKYPTPRVIPT